MALAPPYRAVVPLHSVDGAELSLGSVVLARGAATIAALAGLTALSHRAPWIVPSLALPAPQESLEPLLLVTELRDRLVVLSPGSGDDDVAHVVAAVLKTLPWSVTHTAAYRCLRSRTFGSAADSRCSSR